MSLGLPGPGNVENRSSQVIDQAKSALDDSGSPKKSTTSSNRDLHQSLIDKCQHSLFGSMNPTSNIDGISCKVYKELSTSE